MNQRRLSVMKRMKMFLPEAFLAPRARRLACATFLWLLCGGIWLGGQAATPLHEYVRRVEESARLAADIADNDYGRAPELERLQRISELLPATEDIARDPNQKDVVHIDNSWLHSAITKLDPANENKRVLQLGEICDRLKSLANSLHEMTQPTAEAAGSRERLAQILSREEYQPEAKKDSPLQAWFKKVKGQIIDFFEKLFGSRRIAPRGANSFGGFQIVVVMGLVAILIWALIFLIRRFQLREARVKEETSGNEARVILGEQFEADLTSDDLLKNAAELARKGEYRLAIRRAYIAALYELEQRGKVRLHFAKTNNDYLRELRHEPQLYSPVAFLTGNYERFWYGHLTATMEDYAGFIERYREVAR